MTADRAPGGGARPLQLALVQQALRRLPKMIVASSPM